MGIFRRQGIQIRVRETDKLVKELWNSHVDHVGMIHLPRLKDVKMKHGLYFIFMLKKRQVCALHGYVF